MASHKTSMPMELLEMKAGNGHSKAFVSFVDKCRESLTEMHAAFEHSQANDGTGSRKRSQERLRDEQAWARVDDDGSPVAASQCGMRESIGDRFIDLAA
jgi:hypothetical protein